MHSASLPTSTPPLPPRGSNPPVAAGPPLPPRTNTVTQSMPRPSPTPTQSSTQQQQQHPRVNSSTLPPNVSQTMPRPGQGPVSRNSQTMPRNNQSLSASDGGISGLFGRVFGNKQERTESPAPPQETSEEKKARQYSEYLQLASTMNFDDLMQLKIVYRAGIDLVGRPIVVRDSNSFNSNQKKKKIIFEFSPLVL